MRAAPSVPRVCCSARRGATTARVTRPLAWRCASRPTAVRRTRRVERWRASASEAGEGGEPADDDAPPPLPSDWRDFRARLVASEASEEDEAAPPAPADGRWAHALAGVEKGCILLANPSLFQGDAQPYFSRAVIFLFETTENGAVGVILNRRTERTLGSIPGAEPFTPEFAACPLFLGGDVGPSSMHLLHRDNPDALPSSTTVVRGIAMGGFRDAVSAVRGGAMRAEDFRFFSRYCGWGPGQLEREVEAGVWFLAAASADLVLAQPSDAALRKGAEQEALPASRTGGLWADMLQLMGGEYALIARATLDAEQS